MSSTSWYLPTNVENLELFITYGLITCKAALVDIYLDDIRNDYPQGYIPFFPENNLRDAIEKSTADGDDLVKCIIELDLTQIKNLEVHCKRIGGSYHAYNITGGIEGDYEELLLPSPLPLQCIKKIIFEKKEDRKELSIVDSAGIPLSSSAKEKKLFTDKVVEKQELIFPVIGPNNSENPLSEREVDYDKIFSVGGTLGLMFYQTKNGRESISYFNEVSQLKALEQHKHEDFRIINNYLFNDKEEGDDYINNAWRLLTSLSRSTGEVSTTKYKVLQLLSTLPDKGQFWKQKLEEIENRVVGIEPEQMFDKLMESYSKKVSTGENSQKIFMLLVMYFVRDKTQTMLKFYNENFKNIDYILFSMFFGMASQYIGLPKEIKNIKGLSLYISNRMAEYGHKNEEIEAFKSVKAPLFVINGMIKDKTDGNKDKFIEWFSESLGLNSEEFQHWECSGEEFSCDSNSILTFKDEPKVTTDLNQRKLQKQIDDLEFETDEQLANLKNRFLKIISNLSSKLLIWKIQAAPFECRSTSRSKLTLKYRQQPVLKTVVSLDRLEQQIIKATIGNDKELFDYNKVLEQYNKLVK